MNYGMELSKPSFIKEHLFGILFSGSFGLGFLFQSQGEMELLILAIFFCLLNIGLIIHGIHSYREALQKYKNIQLLQKEGYYKKAKIVARTETIGSKGNVYSYTYICRIKGEDRTYEHITTNKFDVFQVGSEVNIYINEDLFPGLYWIDFATIFDTSSPLKKYSQTLSDPSGASETIKEDIEYYFYKAIFGGNRESFLQLKGFGDFDPEKSFYKKDYIKKILFLSAFIMTFGLVFTSILAAQTSVAGMFNFGEALITASPIYLYFILIAGGYSAIQIRKYSNYQKLITYFEQKKMLEESSKKMSKTILDDVANPEIFPLEIDALSNIIDKIGALIKNLQSLSSNLRSLRKDVPAEAKNELTRFINVEREWIFQYILDFSKVLEYWLKNHENELKNAEDRIEMSQTGDAYSDAIKFAQIKLSNQRGLVEKTEKVLVTL